MIYIFNEMETFSDEDYYHYLPLVSDERLKKINCYHFMKDKKLSLLAYLLLRIGLLLEYEIKEKCIFKYKVNNKPYLERYNNIFFNLSHCKNGVACVLSKFEVGIDIQELTEYLESDAQIVLSKSEISLISSRNNKDELFTTLWALKESYVKQQGLGISDELRNLNFTNFSWHPFYLYDCIFSINKLDDAILSTCSSEFLDIYYIKKSDFSMLK